MTSKQEHIGWTPEDAMLDAKKSYPEDCGYTEWQNGLTAFMQPTVVVECWRNQETWAAGDPPRRTVEGYRR